MNAQQAGGALSRSRPTPRLRALPLMLLPLQPALRPRAAGDHPGSLLGPGDLERLLYLARLLQPAPLPAGPESLRLSGVTFTVLPVTGKLLGPRRRTTSFKGGT